MMETEIIKSETYQRGAQQSLVERFSIEGLYGYRNISLSSQYAATILIAKNGSGKTTLLGALNAFLSIQFSRLRDLDFSQLKCKLRNVEPELVLYHEDVLAFLEVPTDGEFVRFSRKIEVETPALFTFLTEEFVEHRGEFGYLSSNAAYTAIARTVGYSYQEADRICDDWRGSLTARVPGVAIVAEKLREALRDVEIVYLPTYRRIELPLNDQPDEEQPFKRRKPKFVLPGHGLFTGDIQFGLADISERLSTLNQRLLIDSNQGYREVSANIINELIDGKFEKETSIAETIPNKEELELFFSRLKDGRRVGPFNDISVPNIDKIYTGEDISLESRKVLRYFLGKLHTVIKATRDIEGMVEQFIGSCNKYLYGQDLSASLPKDEDQEQELAEVDSKALRLNRRNLKVHVESIPAGRKISLNALSSGEKQMISLFAKLFLYPKTKLVLIDEPELSLSIDWQRQIVVDILNAPLCRQVIAITHSPFIFDNELEPFATALQLAIHPAHKKELTEDEGELGE